MIRIVLHGCNGTMGKVITRLSEKDEDLQIVAGIDVEGNAKYDYPVFIILGVSLIIFKSSGLNNTMFILDI